MRRVTRLCQTMALATGLPVACSQSIVVSRWLVTPMAAMSAAVTPACAHRLARGGQLRRPDRLRIVLDVRRARKDLRELLLGRGDDAAVALEDDRAAGRRALIESEDVGHRDSGLGIGSGFGIRESNSALDALNRVGDAVGARRMMTWISRS